VDQLIYYIKLVAMERTSRLVHPYQIALYEFGST